MFTKSLNKNMNFIYKTAVRPVRKKKNPLLTISKNGLHCGHSSYSQFTEASKCSPLSEQLRARIEMRGPLTVAEYMRAVLTSPSGGYYMHRDVFGHHGDFTTSPEISQLFGEMIGVWYVNELKKFYSPSQPVQFVELGPGRGTLMNDMLRVFKHLWGKDKLSVHLIEISPHLSDLQAALLCKKGSVKRENVLNLNDTQNVTLTNIKEGTSKRQYLVEKDQSESNAIKSKGVPMNTVTVRRPAGVLQSKALKHYQKGLMMDGTPVFWYYSLLDVPHQFSCIMAHEFFDALPVHKFKKTPDGWREVLVTTDPSKGPEHFKFILSRSGTPSSKIFMKPWDDRNEVELCPEAGLLSQQVASRLEEFGGIGLFVDYGYDGENPDTFRAFKEHRQVDPLISPGSADLTADVDFTYIRNAVSDRTVTFGPVLQSTFLKNMGIDVRLKMILDGCPEDKKPLIQSGFEMIMNCMGERYKFFSLFPKTLEEHLKKHPVSGFSEIKQCV